MYLLKAFGSRSLRNSSPLGSGNVQHLFTGHFLEDIRSGTTSELFQIIWFLFVRGQGGNLLFSDPLHIISFNASEQGVITQSGKRNRRQRFKLSAVESQESIIDNARRLQRISPSSPKEKLNLLFNTYQSVTDCLDSSRNKVRNLTHSQASNRKVVQILNSFRSQNGGNVI